MANVVTAMLPLDAPGCGLRVHGEEPADAIFRETVVLGAGIDIRVKAVRIAHAFRKGVHLMCLYSCCSCLTSLRSQLALELRDKK